MQIHVLEKLREKHNIANLTLISYHPKLLCMQYEKTCNLSYNYTAIIMETNLHNNYSVLEYAIPTLCEVHDRHII